MSRFSNEYRVGNSPAYTFCSLALHGGGGVMLLFTSVPTIFSTTAFPATGIAVLMLAWLILGASALADLRRRGVWRGRHAVTHISVSRSHSEQQQGQWRLCHRSGQWFGPAVVTGGRVMSVAIWLQLRDSSGQREAICVPADALSPPVFRRLRVAARAALGQ